MSAAFSVSLRPTREICEIQSARTWLSADARKPTNATSSAIQASAVNRSQSSHADVILGRGRRSSEVLAALGGASPDATAVADRATRRQANLTLDPPAALGPEEPLPALDAAPEPLRRAAAAVLITTPLLDTDLKKDRSPAPASVNASCTVALAPPIRVKRCRSLNPATSS